MYYCYDGLFPNVTAKHSHRGHCGCYGFYALQPVSNDDYAECEPGSMSAFLVFVTILFATITFLVLLYTARTVYELYMSDCLKNNAAGACVTFSLFTSMTSISLFGVYLTVLLGFDDDDYKVNDNARGILVPILFMMVVSSLVEVLMMWIDVLSRANSMRMKAKIEGPTQKWCGVCTIGAHTDFTVVKRCAHAFVLTMGVGVGIGTFWTGAYQMTGVISGLIVLILSGVLASAGHQMQILVGQGSETSGSSPASMAKQIKDVTRRLVGSSLLITCALGAYALLKRNYKTEAAAYLCIQVGCLATNGVVLTLVWYVRQGAMRALSSMGYGPNGNSPHVRIARALSNAFGSINLTSPRRARKATSARFGGTTTNPISRESTSSEISDF